MKKATHPPAHVPEVMDVETAAAYLDLSERTVRTHLHNGLLPGWKIGNLWRLSKSALDGKLVADNANAKKGAGARK